MINRYIEYRQRYVDRSVDWYKQRFIQTQKGIGRQLDLYTDRHINEKQNRWKISYKQIEARFIEKKYIHEKMAQYVPN